MKPAVVFLEQQSWTGGAQRVLEAVMDSIRDEYDCIVAFPDRGPFRASLGAKGTETFSLPIGKYRSGPKSAIEKVLFAFRSVVSGLKLAMVIQRSGMRLIYVNGPRCLPAGILAARLTAVPVIFHLHLILDRKMESRLVAWLARHTSTILTCSQAAARPLLDRDPRLAPRTRVLYNPVPPSETTHRLDDGAATDRFTVGVVGRITKSKGQHLLVGAIGALPTRLRRKVRLLIVGSGEPGSRVDARYASSIRAEVDRLGLAQHVEWVGQQSEMDPWYASMHLLVQPSLVEAMSMVILEALQHGIPVIAAHAGGTPEVVRHDFNGLLVPAGDAEALAEALALILSDPTVRGRLHAGAAIGLDRRFEPETFSSGIRDAVDALTIAAPRRVRRLSTERRGEA